MIVNPFVFKKYDIRGIVDIDMPPSFAHGLGKVFGTKMRRSGLTRIVVGRDCRLSSDSLYEHLCAGLMAVGCTVQNIGVCTSPMLYFALHRLPVDGGIMITGSHNAKEYNGFKIAVGKETIWGEEIQKLRHMMDSDDWDCVGHGDVTDVSITDEYREYIVDVCNIKKPLTVVVDGGNGAAGESAVAILEDLGCTIIPLYCDMDGNFPNHHPDPTKPKNLLSLAHTVVSRGADVGIAFDGDGDRVGAVDEKGGMWFGDSLMILYTTEILSRKPGATFISEVKSSKHMYEEIRRLGGNPIMWQTGHSVIKAKMHETGAELAGELSGHMFFKDRFFGFDDGIYAACRLLEILSATDRPFSVLLDHIPVSHKTPEIHIDCPDEYKHTIVDKASALFKSEGTEIIDIDGVRVHFSDGWGLLRASNTQPALTMRFEADTHDALNRIQALFMERVESLLEEHA